MGVYSQRNIQRIKSPIYCRNDCKALRSLCAVHSMQHLMKLIFSHCQCNLGSSHRHFPLFTGLICFCQPISLRVHLSKTNRSLPLTGRKRSSNSGSMLCLLHIVWHLSWQGPFQCRYLKCKVRITPHTAQLLPLQGPFQCKYLKQNNHCHYVANKCDIASFPGDMTWHSLEYVNACIWGRRFSNR